MRVAAAAAALGVVLACWAPGAAAGDPGQCANPVAELQAARQALIDEVLHPLNAHPMLVRLAWHDSGTYDKAVPASEWPKAGGANGSIRFARELGHAANAGLSRAIELLAPIKERFAVSWADLIQLASATAIEDAGGPRIPMRYGRVDTATEEECPAEGNLPGAEPPFPNGEPDAATHLRNVFYRMGFQDRDIVALSGAHTLGRAFKDRSGAAPEASGGEGTEYTQPGAKPHGRDTEVAYNPGGRSWTPKWLVFDNSYFKRTPEEPSLLWLSSDRATHEDSSFKDAFDAFAASQDTFFEAYSAAHAKLSELGSKFEPPEGIVVD